MHKWLEGGVYGLPKLNGDPGILGLADELLVTQYS
jgi:hypothetical protein